MIYRRSLELGKNILEDRNQYEDLADEISNLVKAIPHNLGVRIAK